uniref:MLO-like protein n=1 Tax=Leersia perrieri TaxID=77586 RepID=A0A0D9XPQ1_9ORYZ
MVMEEGRSLAETPTWSVATVTTLMVAACFLVERGLSRFAKWLRKTKRKAMLAALEKIREELMLLGVISLLLSQTARWISEICVPSSLFTSRFYICSETDYEDLVVGGKRSTMETNQTVVPNGVFGYLPQNVCSEGHEPFVSYEGLEQLHRFLFILGITHVLYTFITVVLSMIKIYSWRKFETQACQLPTEQLQAGRTKVMQRQSTFVFHHTSHPWSKNKILIWMDFLRSSASCLLVNLLISTISCHTHMTSTNIWYGAWKMIIMEVSASGLNIYFWISFVPAILVLLVGTELQHVIAQLALEVVEATAPYVGTQLKLRDDLFWFGKPRVLWWLIQFISFQLELSAQSCFMKNHYMIVLRLTSGLLVQFWCSYNTLPLNVFITQMGSKFKKSLISENVRESLHSWCKRVKDKNRHNPLFARNGTVTSRSVCSLDTTYEETDHETNTVCTLSRTVSATSLDELTVVTVEDNDEEMSRVEQDL